MERHWQRLYRLAWRILGSAEDAEDASQEAFMNAWERIDTYRGDAPVGAWLSRIAAHAAIDRYRRRRARRELPVLAEEEAPQFASAAPGPDRSAAGSEFRAALDRARAGLSAHQRAAFELKAVEGEDFQTIGSLLGCGASSARQHFFRALRKLRAELEAYR